MGHDVEKPDRGNTPKPPRKQRLETQIHRRKKVKAVLPLQAEWDSGSAHPPTELRMPPGRMKKGGHGTT